MLAIYKRELKSYFRSFIGFLFIAVTLFFLGLYFSVYNLMNGYPYFAYVVSSVTFLFMLTVPILTMRILAEEKRSKTDQLILTAPVSVGGIIMGKFLALLTIFAIPVAIICFYPLIMAQYGSVPMGEAYLSILAYFLFGMTLTAAYPFLRMSAVLAQPDWFGLIFAFAILLLTLDFRFDKLEPVRFGLIFLATAAIILARRWFLYFVVGYYFAYALLLIAGCVRLAKGGEKNAALVRVKNLVLFGLASVVAMVILLWPMVSHILAYNYAGRYSYYNGGGLALEAFYHIGRMGLFNILLMVLGLAFAAKHRAPSLPCLAGCELVVSILLFTRVQNTGSHQFLLFLPGYFILFLLGAAALAEGITRRRNLKLGCWAFVLVLSMSVRCSPLTTLAMPGFVIEHFPIQIPATQYFISLDKLIYDRKDIGQIQAIADWINTHCDEGELCYMIPHDMLYNPDHFKNCRLPDAPINDKLAFGFSVPGTHNFPMQFFEAKYVITCEPFPQTYVGSGEMSIKFNDRFLAVRDQYFTFEKSFDMGNGTTFTIWKRTAAPTREEVEYYLSAFAEEDAQYPEMFSQVAEAWLTAHGL